MINIHLLCLIFLIQPIYSSYYYDETKSEWLYIQTPVSSIFLGPQNGNITANLTFQSSEYLCNQNQNDFPELQPSPFQRIVLTRGIGESFFNVYCSYEQVALNAQRLGAFGVIFLSESENAGITAYWQEGGHQVNILCVTSYGGYFSNFELDKDVVFNLIPETNPYVSFFYYARFFWWIILAPCAFICVALSFNGIFVFYLKNSKKIFWNLQIGCLYAEGISNLIRLIYIIIDPAFSTGKIRRSIGNILFFSTEPITLAVTIMIAIYWKTIVSNVKSMKHKDVVISYYYYVLIFFVLLLSYVSASLSSLYIDASFILIFNAIIVIFINTFVATYFLKSGKEMISLLEDHTKQMISLQERNSWSSTALRKITLWVTSCSIFLYFSIVLGVLQIFLIKIISPFLLAALYICFYIYLICLSFTHTMAFVVTSEKTIKQSDSSLYVGHGISESISRKLEY